MSENIAFELRPGKRADVIAFLKPSRALSPEGYKWSLPSDNDNEHTAYVFNNVDETLPADKQPKLYHVGAPRTVIVIDADIDLLTERRPADVPEPNVIGRYGERAYAIWSLVENIHGNFDILAQKVGGSLVPDNGAISVADPIHFNAERVYKLPARAPVNSIGDLKTIELDWEALGRDFPKVSPDVWGAIRNGTATGPITENNNDGSRSGIGWSAMLALAGAGVPDNAIYTIWQQEPIGEYLRERGRDFESAFRRELGRARQKVVLDRVQPLLEPTLPRADGDREVVPLPDPIPKRPIIVKGLLQRKVITLVAGKGGDGKSLFTLQMAVAAALGREWAGFKPVSRLKVLYINVEDDYEEVQRRLAAICLQMKVEPDDLKGWLHIYPGSEVKLSMIEDKGPNARVTGTSALRDLIGWCQQDGYDIVVADPLVELAEGINENDNMHMAGFMTQLKRLAREGNVALMLVHHFRKQGVGGDADSMRGGSAIVNAARLGLTFERVGADAKMSFPGHKPENVIRVMGAKANYQPLNKSLYLAFVAHAVNDDDQVAALVPVELTDADVFDGWDALVTMVDGANLTPAKTGSPETRLDNAVMNRFGMTIQDARKVIAEAAGRGLIIEREKTVNGHKKKVWEKAEQLQF